MLPGVRPVQRGPPATATHAPAPSHAEDWRPGPVTAPCHTAPGLCSSRGNHYDVLAKVGMWSWFLVYMMKGKVELVLKEVYWEENGEDGNARKEE